MTTLEVILITILWIGYGLFAAYQSRDVTHDQIGTYIMYIIFAPVVFIVKMMYGAFKKYQE